MPNRKHPQTCACRVSDRELARVDAAARLSGFSHRAAYVREVVLSQAERDLRSEVREVEAEASEVAKVDE